ncbi:MAG TPA: SDR family oxidoreductase [Afifellaceae bacterium]|nr:SDR family oxidoreductase [Afifellaceae bacterium]
MTDRPVALITGGASGIGEASARRLATDGYRIAILDLSDTAEVVAKDLGGQAMLADVTDTAALQSAIGELAADWGRIDACVCSAGVLEKPGTIMDGDPEAEARIWAVNYQGTVNTVRAVGRVMERQRSGSIVTLGSINSYAALPLPAYCPSKTAILRLTEMLAVELGRFGIRVNGVAPTYILTPALKAKIESGERDPDIVRGANALNNWIEPRDVADVIAFLCSDEARAVSGVMLPVDAGHLPAERYRAFAGGVPWQT